MNTIKDKLSVKLSREVVLRILADILLINFSVLTALVARLLYKVIFETNLPGTNFTSIFWRYVDYYGTSIWILTLICLLVFFLSGFYTYGRVYRGRYKVLIVIQAVTLSFLIFGFLSYFMSGLVSLPRTVTIMAWIITTIIMVMARLWAYLWSAVVRTEFQGGLDQQELPMRSILLIGGAGYIGSALLPKLLDKGYRVRVLDLLLFGIEPIQDYLNHPNLEIIQADFRHVDKVTESMQGIDAVIHLGAIVGDPACALNEKLTIEINLMATRMIAEVAKGSGVSRFIFASTCSVYGTSDEILDEYSVLAPISLYARSKIASENVLMNMSNERFAPTLLRFGTIYGISGRTRFDLVVNLLTAKALIDRKITIYGGEQFRPFLHIGDAALAILKVLEAPVPLVHSQIFNVGSNNQNYTIRQVGEFIHRLIPEAELVNTESPSDLRNYRVDFAKIEKALDYNTQKSLDTGIMEVMDLIQSGKVENYNEIQFSNVKFLNEQGLQIIRTENEWAQEMINGANPDLNLERVQANDAFNITLDPDNMNS